MSLKLGPWHPLLSAVSIFKEPSDHEEGPCAARVELIVAV